MALWAATLFALCGVSLASSSAPSLSSVRTLFEFPKQSYIENLAVRSNGQILISDLSTSQLYLFDPSAPGPSQPVVVHDFTESLGLAGIAEYQPDVFAVISDLRGVGISSSHGKPGLTSPPVVKNIAHVKPAQFLNGISVLSQKDQTLLVGDVNGGVIWSLDIKTGHYEVAINNTFTKLYASPPFSASGVDGVHVRGNSVYFTNFGNGTFNKMPINSDGTSTGPVTTIAHTKGPLDQYDDFTFDCDGNAFVVTGGGNTIELISADGKRQVYFAGNLNSTAIAEPTSCAFGRGPHDKNVLYVVTAGGMQTPVNGDIVIGGQLVAINTTSRGSAC
ncbi:SMP-30/Gluconolaconase/LRE-like region domain-containing protein [Trichoderma breve]|uniref:SMP-30/Gluconolaconase/LRE-like region domain-containing protein n=1 Tax=Trichoderma breve TaxID=2034170 RepID=A0A9W9E3U5_9HYPO|nr:SMP-30/Gluconolaconase/LRE-like region domain-containing protein [Trichoderma breve]KAJ4857119.1 SMP-30/Gluconolaconase/LRE-like region domain-containing protein [Trichoderma breve]